MMEQQSTGQPDDEERKKNEALKKEMEDMKNKLAQMETERVKKEKEMEKEMSIKEMLR